MATFTINTTTQQDDRILAAFQDLVGDETAGAAEVKAWMINHLKGMVHSYETRVVNEAASAAVVPIDPT